MAIAKPEYVPNIFPPKRYHYQHGVVYFTRENSRRNRFREIVIDVSFKQEENFDSIMDRRIEDRPLVIVLNDDDKKYVKDRKWAKSIISMIPELWQAPSMYERSVSWYHRSRTYYTEGRENYSNSAKLETFAYMLSYVPESFPYLTQIVTNRVPWIEWDREFNPITYPMLWESPAYSAPPSENEDEQEIVRSNAALLSSDSTINNPRDFNDIRNNIPMDADDGMTNGNSSLAPSSPLQLLPTPHPLFPSPPPPYRSPMTASEINCNLDSVSPPYSPSSMVMSEISSLPSPFMRDEDPFMGNDQDETQPLNLANSTIGNRTITPE